MTDLWPLIIIAAAYLSLHFAKSYWAYRYAMGHPDTETVVSEPIDVLQPILSGDPDLPSALRDNVSQTSERVRFLWIVDDDDAEALTITQTLQAEFPNRILRVVVAPYSGQGNPKIQKLVAALPQVQASWLAVLDDDTRCSETQLASAIPWLRKGATLYTGLPSYEPANNTASRLIAAFVNVSAAQTYLAPLRFTTPLTLNGMFYVVTSKWLIESQTLTSIQNELCDDYALARAISRQQGSIHQAVTAQRIRTTVRGASHYCSLMHRWMLFADLLVRDQPLPVQGLLLLLLGLPPVLLLALLLLWLSVFPSQISAAIVVVATLLLRELSLRALRVAIHQPRVPPSPLLGLIAELLIPMHTLHAIFWRTIRWRTRTFRVAYQGEFQEVNRL